MDELSKYLGNPMCQDCGWKLGSLITENCPCLGNIDDATMDKYGAGLKEARKLIEEKEKNGTTVIC